MKKEEKEKNVNEKIFLNLIMKKENFKIYIFILVLSIELQYIWDNKYKKRTPCVKIIINNNTQRSSYE